MGREEPAYLAVGFVRKPHGIRGEVLVSALTDHPEGIFSPGVVLLPAGPGGREPDPDRPPMRLASVRPFRDGVLAVFGGVESRDEAEALRGTYLLARFEDVPPLEEGEVFYHQLLGMRVETVDGEGVGVVREVYEMAPADLLEVRTPGGTLLIPFRRELVVEVDVEAGLLVIDPPEGLLDLEAP